MNHPTISTFESTPEVWKADRLCWAGRFEIGAQTTQWMDSNSRRHVLGNQLDIEQILLEAQHRWLRPAEICEILQNYKSFRICPEPADKPPSGSLFLFDRKVLRYFRKDGHNWRKKKDGKTVKEAHERLKAGSVDVLHCYYAHGEANESFQRRSYWMLEESLSHIVLVHYRDVKGNRTSISQTREYVERSHAAWEAGDNLSESEISNSASSSMQRSSYQNHSPTIETTSLSSMHASQYEDAESAYNEQNSSGLHSYFEVHTHVNGNLVGSSNTYYTVSNDYQDKRSDYGGIDITSLTRVGTSEDGAGLGYERQKHNDFPSWEHVLKNCAGEIPSMGFESSLLPARPDNTGNIFKLESHKLGQLMTDGFTNKLEIASDVQYQGEWLTSDGFSSDLSKWPLDIEYNSNADGRETGSLNLLGSMESSHSHPSEPDEPPKLEPQAIKLDSDLFPDDRGVMKHSLLHGPVNEDGLRKLDSFNRWMSKELGDVDDSVVQSSSGAYWSAVESENAIDDSGGASQGHLDADMVGPSLSMDQLFSIIDFSPNWAYEDSEIKVLITGKFLKGQSEVEKLKWSCMFGEIEVPAEVIAEGVLRCLAPHHKYGRVPFYVTCSNRFACSEVREFEYRAHPVRESVDADTSKEQEIIFHMRLLKLLSLGLDPPDYDSKVPGDNSNLSAKISDLMNEDEDEWDQMLKTTSAENFPSERMKDQLIQKLLKEKLHVWLLHKASEGGKGANVLDEDGQGVLHLAAALGYGWAIPPTILAGVNINFRDVNGWTALHWAAFCGRERTVASLISLGAAAGALTDPTPKYPSGRTAADLAAMNRHKGIAGYLAENALAAHLTSLDLKDPIASDAVDVSGVKAVQAVVERDANPITDSHIPYGVSLKDSLTAVCNATQAAARITQVFRAQSFQRKQVQEYEDDERSSEAALSHIALKQQNAFHGGPVDAATRIQKNYRSYKGRKEYLIIRQRIVKLQAHVRGHQVRKNYRKFIWSVGILEKVILRWRRKGSGLRGFKPEGQIEGATSNTSSSKEDDYDFFKEGRKQTEERLQKALARVKSMVQYPESRAQYQRLLNVVSEIQETKGAYDRALNTNADEMADFDDDLIDLEALLDADEMDSLMMAES